MKGFGITAVDQIGFMFFITERGQDSPWKFFGEEREIFFFVKRKGQQIIFGIALFEKDLENQKPCCVFQFPQFDPLLDLDLSDPFRFGPEPPGLFEIRRENFLFKNFLRRFSGLRPIVASDYVESIMFVVNSHFT